EQHITITSGSSMSDAEIDKAVKEAAQYEAEDKKRKDAVDTKNEADSTVFQVEKALKEVGDKVPADQKSGVEADLNALKDLLAKAPADGSLTDAQVTDIKAAKEKLMNSSQALFTKMYENMQQNQGGPNPGAGPQGGSTGAGNNGGDDVVDADYKEV
ncbi:MAG: Hsp70 family protein, partial [Bilifractor sp.]